MTIYLIRTVEFDSSFKTLLKTVWSFYIKIIFKLHALEHAQPAKQEAQVTGACLSILMGCANIFAHLMDIVGLETNTKLVMTVVVANIQVIFKVWILT